MNICTIAALFWGLVICLILGAGVVAVGFIYWNDGYKAGREDEKKAQP